MTEYSLYCLNVAGKISGPADRFLARSDDEAIFLVRTKCMPSNCEIWQRSRLVAHVLTPASSAEPR